METIRTILFIFLVIGGTYIITMTLVIFMTFGPTINEEHFNSIFKENETVLANLFDHTIIHQESWGDELFLTYTPKPCRFISKYYIHGVGGIPIWSKVNKRLDVLYKDINEKYKEENLKS